MKKLIVIDESNEIPSCGSDYFKLGESTLPLYGKEYTEIEIRCPSSSLSSKDLQLLAILYRPKAISNVKKNDIYPRTAKVNR